jgi:hypothetical protein
MAKLVVLERVSSGAIFVSLMVLAHCNRSDG